VPDIHTVTAKYPISQPPYFIISNYRQDCNRIFKNDDSALFSFNKTPLTAFLSQGICEKRAAAATRQPYISKYQFF
jgi:hypothetical protein